jgi:hypothetical protein
VRQARTIEVADDQNQGNVMVPSAVLKQIEKLVESMGMGESTMPITMHHFLVGGLAYLASAPVSKMKTNEIKALVSKNKAAIRTLARSVAKNTSEQDTSEDGE